MYNVTGHAADGQVRETLTCSAEEIKGAYQRLKGSAWIDVTIEDRRVEVAVTRAGCRAGVKISEIWDPRDFSIIRVGHRCQKCS